MNSEQKYYSDSNFGEKIEKEEVSTDVMSILELYRLLSLSDKIGFKRLLQKEKLFL